ncbi:MAG TPA: energy transducer TonB [Gemmatimonadales bacterium]|jgi:TonB family protein
MELRLLETKRKFQKKTLFRVGATSLALHAAVIGGAVYVTLSARPADTAVRMDTSVVLLAPAQRQPALPPPAQLAEPLRGFQTVTVPTQLPTSMPKLDLQERFDPKDYSGIGVEGGRANGVVPSGNEVYSEALVEERPALLSAPPAPYPDLLKRAGIHGRVLLRAIVDTTGRVEPSSIEIATSPNPGFDQPAREWILKALFRPARVHGRAVRVHITQPLDYSVTSG